jgi:pyridoxine 5-phosphate synthase
MPTASYIRLGVNIDHCATLRQARYHGYPRGRGEMVEPDPTAFAQTVERAGADGITVHPREDGRHIQRDDVRAMRACLQVPLNLEMACTSGMLAFALEIAPAWTCLVPERREEVTTEGGLDVAGQRARVAEIVAALRAAGIAVSLFVDPDPVQVETAVEIGAHAVELHTGAFANAWYRPADCACELQALREAAALGRSVGLLVNIGHGINYANVADVRAIPGIHEMNIGHAILSRSLFNGVTEAVREMKCRMNPGLVP